LLLEVVVAMTIMIVTLAVMGAQLNTGLRTTYTADDITHGAALADRFLATIELDLERQRSIFEDEQREGDFGPQYPGYYWELVIEPLDEEDVGVTLVDDETGEETQVAQLTVYIYRDANVGFYEEFSGTRPDGARLIHSVHVIRATPARIDLQEDFGLTEEQVTGISDVLPDIDPNNFNPQELLQMISEDPESFAMLLQDERILPLLQQFGIGDASQLQGMLSGDLGGLQDMLGGGAEGGGGAAGADALQRLLDLRDQLQPGAGGGGRGGAGGRAGGNRSARGGGGDGANDGGGRGGNRDGGTAPRAGGSRYTIEDLLRLRDELQQGAR
jgi:hypothetical protein